MYVDDHEPPHVHVLGDGELKVLIDGRGGRPEVLENHGMKTGDLRKAVQEIADRREHLLAAWRRIRGR